MNLSSSWDYIESIANSRLAHNKTERHVQNNGELEIIGAAGELAARRYLGLSENLHEHFDGGVDIVWNGITIDVKATRFTSKVQYRYMQWPFWKYVKSDIVLLVGVNVENKFAALLGFATAAEIRAAPINDSRKIPCHEIPVEDLTQPWKLLMASPGIMSRDRARELVGL